MTDDEIWAGLDVDAVISTPSVSFDELCDQAEDLFKRAASMTREEAEQVLRKLKKQ